MANNQNTLTFPLDLGMRNTSESQPQPTGDAPALKESLNTRLGVIEGVPTKAPAVTQVSAAVSGRTAIVPSGSGDMLVLSRRENELVTADGDVASFVRSYLEGPTGTIRQNGYFPYVPENECVVPGGRGRLVGTTAIAITNDGTGHGETWFAQMRFNGMSTSAACSIMVSVLAADGSVAAPPVVITTTDPNSGWCGLTAHDNANGVVLWYRTASGTDVAYRRLSRSGTSIVDGGAVTLVTPAAISEPQLAVHSDNHANYAYVATVSVSTANSIRVTRRDIIAATSTTLSISVGTTTNNLAIRHITYSGIEYVALIAYGGDGTVRVWLIDGTTMSTTWGPINLGTGFPTSGGTVAVSFLFHPTQGSHVIAAATRSHFGFGGNILTSPAFTRFVPMAITDGSGSYSIEAKWKGLISNGAWDRLGTVVQPLFGLQNWFAQSTNDLPGSNQFVSDPSAEIYRAYAPYSITPVARFGVDTAQIRKLTPAGRSCNLAQGPDGRIWYSYLESTTFKTGDLATSTSKYVTLGVDAPSTATDSDGVTAIAAGPAYFDGIESAEWCPTQRPVVVVEANTGTAAPTPGTYRLSAVVYWDDGTGQERRSMPAEVVTHTVTGPNQPKIYVTIPGSATMRNGSSQESVRVKLYSSMDGQSGPLYAQPFWQLTALGTYFAEFNAISTPTTGPYSPPIYSTASASDVLAAQCPPSFRDIAIVGNRMWGMEADGTLWPSKPKEDGVAFEFNSQLKTTLPASAGRLIGLEELGGNLVVLTRKGAWIITGQGPDAALGGGAFNAPEQISDIPCVSRDSIVRTPSGIFYQSDNRFATIGGDQGASLLDDYLPYAGASYTAVSLTKTKEVVWFFSEYLSDGTDETRHVVYNWALRRFTHWNTEVVEGVSSVCLNQSTGDWWMVDENATIRSMDPISSGDASMTFASGDIRMGGIDEADCTLQNVLLSAKRLSDHVVFFGVGQDYAPATKAEFYDATQILNSTITANSRYTLCLEPKTRGSMRAVSVTAVIIGAGDCVRPYEVTLIYKQNPGTMTEAVNNTAKR